MGRKSTSSRRKTTAKTNPSQTSFFLAVAFYGALAAIILGLNVKFHNEVMQFEAAKAEPAPTLIWWEETREFEDPGKRYYVFWMETRSDSEPENKEMPIPLDSEYGKAALTPEAYRKYVESGQPHIANFSWVLQPATTWTGLEEPTWTCPGYLPPEVIRRIPPNGRIEEKNYTAAFRLIVDWQGNPTDLSYLMEKEGNRPVIEDNKFIIAEGKSWTDLFRNGQLPHPAKLSEEEHAKVRNANPGLPDVNALLTAAPDYYKLPDDWNDVEGPAWAHVGALPDEVRERLSKEGYINEREYLAAWALLADGNGGYVNAKGPPVRGPDGRLYRMPEEIVQAVIGGAIPPPVAQPKETSDVLMQTIGQQPDFGTMITKAVGLPRLSAELGLTQEELYSRTAWRQTWLQYGWWAFFFFLVVLVVTLVRHKPIFPF